MYDLALALGLFGGGVLIGRIIYSLLNRFFPEDDD